MMQFDVDQLNKKPEILQFKILSISMIDSTVKLQSKVYLSCILIILIFKKKKKYYRQKHLNIYLFFHIIFILK